MEEQKIGSKEVKMNVAKNNSEKPQKLSYEQLNQACAELSQQLQNQNIYIQKMRQQMQQMDMLLQSKRMDYLFKVIEIQEAKRDGFIFPEEFYFNCVHEIQESLTIPEEDDKKEQEE